MYAQKVNSMKTGNDLFRFSTSSNPVMLVSLDSSRRDIFKNIEVYGINSIRFEISY